MLNISVNICTYNEEENIRACLESVLINKPAEIIVVDGGSTDRTEEICTEFGVKFVKSGKGLASQREEALRHSSQDYIALIDADDVISPNFLEQLITEMQEHRFDAIQGREIAREPITYWEKAMGFVNHQITFTATPEPTNMVGRPSVYRAEALKYVGFDPLFNGVGDEDTDLAIRFEAAGYRQGVGTGLAKRKQDETFKEIWKKFRKYGLGDARIFMKYPEKRINLLYHLSVRYPIIRGGKAILSKGGKYYPFFFMYGYVRLIYLVYGIIELRLKGIKVERFKL